MRFVMTKPTWRKLVNLLRRRRLARDLDEEMRAHLELRITEQVERGLAETDARREALRRFGNARALGERNLDLWSLQPIESLIADLRHAVRLLSRTPAFTATAVVLLGLAIGANTALFSLANALLLRPLPVDQPDRLVALRSVSASGK